MVVQFYNSDKAGLEACRESLNEIMAQTIENMPPWNPGRQGGEAISSYVEQVANFQLGSELQ